MKHTSGGGEVEQAVIGCCRYHGDGRDIIVLHVAEVLRCLHDGGKEPYTDVAGHDVGEAKAYERLMFVDRYLEIQ